MKASVILENISRGRTDLIIPLLNKPDWYNYLISGTISCVQWLVYYNDLTALKLIEEKGFDFEQIDLDAELGNAAFFGHWKICDFLIGLGADVNAEIDVTGETPLHNALSKAGRPYYRYVVELLLSHGANPNTPTKPNIESGAFMRDVRTRGETPLHRAAAFADESTIELLLDYGADKTIRDSNGDRAWILGGRYRDPGSLPFHLQPLRTIPTAITWQCEL